MTLRTPGVSGDIGGWKLSPMVELRTLALGGTGVSGDINSWAYTSMTKLEQLSLYGTHAAGDHDADEEP